MASLPRAAAHAFVDDVAAPDLDAGDRHHLARVLRLRDGQAVTVADGRGRWRLCAWRGEGRMEPVGEVVEEAPPDPPVTVAFALTKGERPEWV
ncbi:MAG: RNA methyltransferase PUA domain-containing protein, partial [Acidimicrobiia bacterium]